VGEPGGRGRGRPGGSRFTSALLDATAHEATVVWSSLEDLGIGTFSPAFANLTLPNGASGYFTDLIAPYGDPFTVRRVPTRLAADPVGGAFVQFGTTALARLDGNGAQLWPADRSLSTVGRLLADESGGVFGIGISGVVVDRRAPEGSVPAGWSDSGFMVSPGPTFGVVASVVVPGGLLLCWSEVAGNRGADIHAAEVTHDGALAPGWAAGGTVLHSVRRDQTTPALVASAGGTGLAAWRDLRKSEGDIYGVVVALVGGRAPTTHEDFEDAEDAAGPSHAPLAHAPALAVESAGSGAPVVRFALAEPGAASLDIVDVAGRRVLGLPLAAGAGAARRLEIPVAGLERGLYWAVLRQGPVRLTTRFAVTR